MTKFQDTITKARRRRETLISLSSDILSNKWVRQTEKLLVLEAVV